LLQESRIPDYYPKLERGMGDLKDPKLIYSVGRGLYIHVRGPTLPTAGTSMCPSNPAWTWITAV